MEIMNLEINILYFLCSPDAGNREPDQIGPMEIRRVINAFSDIPEKNVRDTLQSMVGSGLITMDLKNRRLSIAQKGIARLQSSIACRTHRFDSCRCDVSRDY